MFHTPSKLFTLLLATTSMSSYVSAKDKCYALAMSGGGAYGSYEAGVLYGMYHALDDKSLMAYDVITGVSAGSFNTLGTALFAVGDEGNMVEFLYDLWLHSSTGEVMKNWPFGIIQGAVEEQGLFDDTPLFGYLGGQVEKYGPIKDREVIFSAADANSGAYVQFDQKYKDIVKATVSSGSVPVAFPPQIFPETNQVLMDGGTEFNVNMVSAIKFCRDKGFADEDIVADIINAESYSVGDYNSSETIHNFMRYRNIKQYYKSMNDVVEFNRAFPSIDFRYFFSPSEKYAGFILDFSPKSTTQAMGIGKKDGANMVQAKKAMESLHEYWHSPTDLKSKFPRVTDYADHLINTDSQPEFIQK